MMAAIHLFNVLSHLADFAHWLARRLPIKKSPGFNYNLPIS
jgi:hypothetical protein